VLKRVVKLRVVNQSLDIIDIAKDGAVSKRRVKVLRINQDSFQAYCFLRGSERTFRFDNVLALVPVVLKESMVI